MAFLAAAIPAVIGAVGGSAAAAGLGAAAIGAGATLIASHNATHAANTANDAQQAADAAALAAQQHAHDQNVALNQPYIQGGYGAYDRLLSTFGLPPSGASYGGQPAPQPAPQTGYGAGNPAAGGVRGQDYINDEPIPPPGAPTSDFRAPVGTPQAAPPASAPGGQRIDGNQYIQDNPDVAANFYALLSSPQGIDNPALGGARSPAEYAQVHYAADGQAEGRPAVMLPGQPQGPQGPQGPVNPNTGRPDVGAPTTIAPPTFTRPDGSPAPNVAQYINPANFHTDPGYQFQVNQALDAVNARSAARGMLRSGSAVQGLQTQAQGLADQSYGNWFSRQMQAYNADTGAYQYGQNRQDTNFASDRSNADNLWLTGQNRSDNIWNTAANRSDANFTSDRTYATSRYDTNIGNLFRLAGVGASAAGAVAGSNNNFANQATGIYGSEANAASDAAYARSNANNYAIQGLAGTAQNLFSGRNTNSNPSSGYVGADYANAPELRGLF